MEFLYRIFKRYDAVSMSDVVLPWHVDEITILAFGDAKVGKTSVLERFNNSLSDEVMWEKDFFSPGGSDGYRRYKSGFFWHMSTPHNNGRRKVNVVRR